MTRYIVFEPGEGASDAAAFVRDRYSVWAFLLSFLWLLRYRLWLEAILVLALAIGISLLGEVDGFEWGAGVLALLLGLLVALEGPSRRAARYRRKGWREAAAFLAEDRQAAEIIYYAGRQNFARQPPQAASPTPVRRMPSPARSLFDMPKAR